jgi:hypothetical protein
MVRKGFDLVTLLGDSRIMAAAATAMVAGVKGDCKGGPSSRTY